MFMSLPTRISRIMSTPKRVLLIFCASCLLACNSNPENNQTESTTDSNGPSLDAEELMDFHVSARKRIRDMLNDSILFQDTQYFFDRVGPTIQLLDQTTFHLDTLRLANRNDTLLKSSSDRLIADYQQLLKHDFRELFTLYRADGDSASIKFDMRREAIYTSFTETDQYSIDNFHRFAKMMGYEVEVLNPIKIKSYE